jgi:hypothetical protein
MNLKIVVWKIRFGKRGYRYINIRTELKRSYMELWIVSRSGLLWAWYGNFSVRKGERRSFFWPSKRLWVHIECLCARNYYYFYYPHYSSFSSSSSYYYYCFSLLITDILDIIQEQFFMTNTVCLFLWCRSSDILQELSGRLTHASELEVRSNIDQIK